MDKISEEKRSWNMSRIQGKNTKPEITVRSMLFKMGYRFRIHRRDLPGSPDIVLSRLRTAIFVHGCFWHRHIGCQFAYSPKSRVHFWEKKFKENIRRDCLNIEQLSELGWRVFVIWECETRDLIKLSRKIRQLMDQV